MSGNVAARGGLGMVSRFPPYARAYARMEQTSEGSPTLPTIDDDEWKERLRAAVAEVLARRQRKAAIRADLARTRSYGLEARHTNKLRHNAGDTKEN